MDWIVLLCVFVGTSQFALADRPTIGKASTKLPSKSRAGVLQNAPPSMAESTLQLGQEDVQMAHGLNASSTVEEPHPDSENQMLMQAWGVSDDHESDTTEADFGEVHAEESESDHEPSDSVWDEEEERDMPAMAMESLADMHSFDEAGPVKKNLGKKNAKGKKGPGKSGKKNAKGGRKKGGNKGANKGAKKDGKAKGKRAKSQAQEDSSSNSSDVGATKSHDLCPDLCVQCPSDGGNDMPPTWFGGKNILVIRHWIQKMEETKHEEACYIDRLSFGKAKNEVVELTTQTMAWFIKQPIFNNKNELPAGLSFTHDPYEWPPIGDYNLIGWWKLATANNRVLDSTRVTVSKEGNEKVDVRYEIRYVPIVSYLEDMVLHNAGQKLTDFKDSAVLSYTKVAYELRMHVKKDYTCKAVFWAKEKVNFEWNSRFSQDYTDKNVQRLAFKAKLLCAKIPAHEQDDAENAKQPAGVDAEEPVPPEPPNGVAQGSLAQADVDRNKQSEGDGPGGGKILGLDDAPENQIPQVQMLKEKRYGYDSDARVALSDCTVSVYMHSFTRLALKFEGENGGCAYAHPDRTAKEGGWAEEAIRDSKSTSDGEELYFEEQRDQARRDGEKEKRLMKEHLGYSFERAIIQANEYASTAVHDDAIHRLTMHPLMCNNMAPAKIVPGSPECLAEQLEENAWNLWPGQDHFVNRHPKNNSNGGGGK